MPSVVIGCGWLDIAAFALGTIAKRDRWFQRAAEGDDPGVAAFLHRQMWFVIPVAIGYFVGSFFMYPAPPPPISAANW